ncbi:MAG: type III-B CRISPR-associated protein Cas10/Cmr2 [Pseudomonadota bacterium]
MKTHDFRNDSDYWDHKLANYLHDPPDKSLRIPGHEERSRTLLQALGELPAPDKYEYQRADVIAAGMDRAHLPGYSADETRSGAVNFLKNPVLTHPTGDESPLFIQLDESVTAAETTQAMCDIVSRDLGRTADGETLGERFRNDPSGFAAARFHYVHHVLRVRLAQENVGGLSGLWYRLPADTRIPDHGIWQHCALVSALTSCFQLSKAHKASIFVFGLSPVQDFISRARKLRDLWTGSLLLSWLTFEGIRRIVCELGSDHLIYPSLIGQPMVDRFLSQELHLPWLSRQGGNDHLGVAASLPNKFVALVPSGEEEHIAENVQDSIRTAWMELSEETRKLVSKAVGAQDDSWLETFFERQCGQYWSFGWAACPLLDDSGRDQIKRVLPEAVWRLPFEFHGSVDKDRFLETEVRLNRGEAELYAVTHALAQSFLAAGKATRVDRGTAEPGIKCGLHGDLEILRFPWRPDTDKNPPARADPFWVTLRRNWTPRSDLKTTERLSSVALVKRLAYRAAKNLNNHPLVPFFDQSGGFPSATEMALSDWLDRVQERGLHAGLIGRRTPWKKILAQAVYERESEDRETERSPDIADLDREDLADGLRVIDKMRKAGDPVGETHRYYAILVMDGDNMGRLVNGETIASRWDTVLHPDLTERLNNPSFDERYRAFWLDRLERARLLSPAVHAAISEALADFAMASVPRAIARHRGRLIYAGGDDVCAVLPASEAIEAAATIADHYRRGFLFFPSDPGRSSEFLGDTWKPEVGRLALHLGAGPHISISAGILICHHKKPLSAAMHRAHQMLEMAKDQGGRDGFAIELDKRSGGGRIFMSKWNERPWSALNLDDHNSTLLEHFIKVGEVLGNPSNQSLSTSLIYRLQEFRTGIEAIVREAPAELVPFLTKQMEQSGGAPSDRELAGRVAAIVARGTDESPDVDINTDSLIVARFIGERRWSLPGKKGNLK